MTLSLINPKRQSSRWRPVNSNIGWGTAPRLAQVDEDSFCGGQVRTWCVPLKSSYAGFSVPCATSATTPFQDKPTSGLQKRDTSRNVMRPVVGVHHLSTLSAGIDLGGNNSYRASGTLQSPHLKPAFYLMTESKANDSSCLPQHSNGLEPRSDWSIVSTHNAWLPACSFSSPIPRLSTSKRQCFGIRTRQLSSLKQGHSAFDCLKGVGEVIYGRMAEARRGLNGCQTHLQAEQNWELDCVYAPVQVSNPATTNPFAAISVDARDQASNSLYEGRVSIPARCIPFGTKKHCASPHNQHRKSTSCA